MGRETTRSTTVLGVIRDGRAAIGSDGQVTLGSSVLKRTARKIRVLGGGNVLAGFAGGGSDALQLFERFESAYESSRGNLVRAAVDVARLWRTDRLLRRLEAQLLVLDTDHLLMLSGNGDLVEPDDPVLAVGSGGGYATAAARALLRHTDLPAPQIVEEALRIAAEICIYTGGTVLVETLPKQD